MSLDGGILPSTWDVAYEQTIVQSGARNPNGCRASRGWAGLHIAGLHRRGADSRGRQTGRHAACLPMHGTAAAVRPSGGCQAGTSRPRRCLQMPMTWFTCCCLHGKDTGDCAVVQQAYELGHEMASHTMSHSEE